MQPIFKIARTLFAFLRRPVEASPKGGGKRRWIAMVLAPVVLAVPFALFLAIDPAPSGNIVTLTIGGDDLSAIACPPSEAVVPVDTGTLSTIGGDLPTDFRLGPNEYALTFDDGPMPWTTPHIAHILKSRCVPATFFMLGISARLFPMIVGTIKSGGFTIGSHTYWHKSLPELPLDKAKAEVLSGMEAVEAAAGGADAGGRLFRFPRWESTPELRDYVHGLGATAVFADITPEDWRGQPAAESFARFRERLDKTDRGIIVLHDVQRHTVELLPMVIDEVTRRGGHFVQLVARR